MPSITRPLHVARRLLDAADRIEREGLESALPETLREFGIPLDSDAARTIGAYLADRGPVIVTRLRERAAQIGAQ